jgi:hypothetical protein
MFKRVDREVQPENIEGYSYENKHGYEEKVVMKEGWVNVTQSDETFIEIYYEDIPNLIKALQAAYKHKAAHE